MNKAVCIKEESLYRIKTGSIYEYHMVSMGDGYNKYVFKIDNDNLRNQLHLHPNDFDKFFIKLETYRDEQINNLINE